MSSLEQFNIKDQVAVVTGSGQGIGRAIALTLAAAGADVVINARRMDDLQQTAHSIEALGRRALIVAGDIRNLSEHIAQQAV